MRCHWPLAYAPLPSLPPTQTNKAAPRYRLVRVDLGASTLPPPEAWQEVVPQQPRDVLQWAAAMKGDRLVTCYLRDVKHVLELRSLSSGALGRPLPIAVGAVESFSGRRDDIDFFIKLKSFTEPGTIFKVRWKGVEPAARCRTGGGVLPSSPPLSFSSTAVQGV